MYKNLNFFEKKKKWDEAEVVQCPFKDPGRINNGLGSLSRLERTLRGVLTYEGILMGHFFTRNP